MRPFWLVFNGSSFFHVSPLAGIIAVGYIPGMAPRYICSGDMPAAHVECSFATDSYDEATRHFEQTSHSVDETPVCADCGLQITELEDIEYSLRTDEIRHTDAFHVELHAECDDEGCGACYEGTAL